MSVPTAELTAPVAGSRPGSRVSAPAARLSGARVYLWIAAGSLLLGALSLLLPSTPSYDPWAWIIWGREIVHLNLQTTGGPSWKPLPLIFTTLFAPFGKAAPDLWLMVARAGAVMMVAMVFKLCMRLVAQLEGDPPAGELTTNARVARLLPGILAGAIAVLGLTMARGVISDNALGYSEGLMTALVLIAVERHLDGKPRQAFAVAFFAALDRPEIWLLWGPYGLWLFWKDPGARRLVAALFVLIPVLWFLPEYWGSGHFFRGVSRAQAVRSNSAANASCPFCAEFGKHAWISVLSRVKIGALLAVGAAGILLWRALRPRGSWRLQTPYERAWFALIVIGGLGLGWWVLIAVMTEAGFSGNDRYLVLGSALLNVAGAVGWGWAAVAIARALPRRISALRERLTANPALASAGVTTLLAVVFVFLPNFVGGSLIDLQRTHRALVYQAHLRESAGGAVDKLGGGGKIFACGSVMTEGFQVPLLAWSLGVHTDNVQAAPVKGQPTPPAPNVIFQTRAQRKSHLLPALSTWPTTSYRLVLRNRTFRVYEHCGK